MVKFVDVPLDVGDPNRAVKELNDAVTESSTNRRQETTTQDTRQTTRSDLDPRFAGKSIEDIVQSYRNLESHSGRLASQLGETKQALNQIILEKRGNDIRQNSTVESVKIQPTDLMVNPTEAIDRLVESRLTQHRAETQQRIANLEAQLGQTTFVSRHPNAQQDTIDPAFQTWVNETPLRQRLNASAANGNMYDADALLTEWNAAKPKAQVTVAQNRAQEAARRLSLEGGNTGSESGNSPSTKGGRTFKRSDLIALRQRDPDKYENEAFQREIMRAYADGRVVD